MTDAGWYPDPAGAPDTYRYWDGQAWSQMTTTQSPSSQSEQPPSAPAVPAAPVTPPTPPTSAAPPSGPAGPTPYGAVPSPPPPPPGAGYGQPQQWSPLPGGAPGAAGGGGGNKTILIAVSAVVALLLFGVAGFFGVRALTGDDEPDPRADPSESSTSGDPKPSESGSPSATVRPTAAQCSGGSPAPKDTVDPTATELRGGGLVLPRDAHHELVGGDQASFAFADEFTLQYANVEANWISLTGVGALAKDRGFDDPAKAAEIVLQCMTGSDRIYRGFTGRTDVKSEKITVDGHDAYRLTAEVRVSDPEVTVEGDVTDVIVVDTGDADTYGVFIAMAAIGHDDLVQANEATIREIKVG